MEIKKTLKIKIIQSNYSSVEDSKTDKAQQDGRGYQTEKSNNTEKRHSVTHDETSPKIDFQVMESEKPKTCPEKNQLNRTQMKPNK